MMNSPRRDTMAGVFGDEATATKALEMLMNEHFSPEIDLSVLVTRDDEKEVVRIQAEPPGDRVALVGGAVAALAGGVAVAIAGLTFGQFSIVACGPLFAVGEAAYVGGVLGISMGVLLCHDFAKTKPAFETARIHGGDVWVGVKAG